MSRVTEWFGEWFDSPYYHILYKHRDYEEARSFIDKLKIYFNFRSEDKILDLACGKGRHSIYLNQLGFNVTGIDLSAKNITYAKSFENDRLRFVKHDMRIPYAENEYDYILNLFTSFGYFDTDEENQKAISAAAIALKPGGKFLLDFLNPYTVIHNLVKAEVKRINHIDFRISRRVNEKNFIVKDISFEDEGCFYNYHEKVKAIHKAEFIQYFEKASLKVKDIFGNYELAEYKEDSSERMIFVAEKM